MLKSISSLDNLDYHYLRLEFYLIPLEKEKLLWQRKKASLKLKVLNLHCIL